MQIYWRRQSTLESGFSHRLPHFVLRGTAAERFQAALAGLVTTETAARSKCAVTKKKRQNISLTYFMHDVLISYILHTR